MTKGRFSILMITILLTGILISSACSRGGSVQPVPDLERALEITLSEVVKPESLDHQLIVFAWPELLLPGDQIGPYNQPGTESFQDPITIEEESWFIWIEDRPAAYFTHPSRFVLISRADGRIQVNDEVWWPVLNGDGLWTSEYAYWNEANWAFHNLDYNPEESSSNLSKFLASPSWITRLEDDKPGAAIVINAWNEGERQEDNFKIDTNGMHDILEESGFDVTFLGPAKDDNPDRDGVLGPENRVKFYEEKAAELKPGDTLVVYVSGHGGGENSDRGSVGGHVIESGLRANLRKFDPGVHIIVIIDSCFSGDFIDGLNEFADITITSTDGSTPSYGAELGNHKLDGVSDPNPDDEGGEFSSGFRLGWKEILKDKTKLDEARRRAESSGTGFWEEVAALSYVRALELDAAYLNGKTSPLSVRGAAQTRPGATATPQDTPTPEPSPTQSLGSMGDYRISMSVKKDNGGHKGFIKMPGSMTLTARECSLCIDGPFPWVNVHGELESDGSFMASGSGTVAGYRNIAVTFQGTISGGQLQGDYTMGVNGGLPGGQPIVYSVNGEKLAPTPVPTTDPRLQEVQNFFNAYNERFGAGDIDGLLSMLDPGVLGLYGVGVCRDYLSSVVENPIQVEALEITSSDPWQWEIDGHSTLIGDVYTVQASVTAGDQTAQQTMHLSLQEDGTINWFTDCGDPQITDPAELFGDQLLSTILDDDYEICGSGCKYQEGTADQSKTLVWCSNGTCPSNGGTCHLFRREKEDSAQEPDSWDYVAGTNQKMQKELDYDYHCFCVK